MIIIELHERWSLRNLLCRPWNLEMLSSCSIVQSYQSNERPFFDGWFMARWPLARPILSLVGHKLQVANHRIKAAKTCAMTRIEQSSRLIALKSAQIDQHKWILWISSNTIVSRHLDFWDSEEFCDKSIQIHEQKARIKAQILSCLIGPNHFRYLTPAASSCGRLERRSFSGQQLGQVYNSFWLQRWPRTHLYRWLEPF